MMACAGRRSYEHAVAGCLVTGFSLVLMGVYGRQRPRRSGYSMRCPVPEGPAKHRLYQI